MEHGNHIDARDDSTLQRAIDRLGPLLERLLSPRATGLEHLAHPGAALVVGNHSGGQMAMFEPLVLAYALRDLGVAQLPTLLLHDVMWRTPLAAWLERAGAVRASKPNTDALLSAGKKVLVYPGGDREVFRPFTHRDRVELGDRRGYVRVAIAHGIPILPVVTSGIQSGFVSLSDGHALARRFPLAKKLRVGVLPVTLSFPFGISFGLPAPYVPLASSVRIRALPPIHFPRTGPEAAADLAYVEACHEHVRTTMQVAADALATERRRARRERIVSFVDRVLAFLERMTLVAPTTTRIAPLPAQPSLEHDAHGAPSIERPRLTLVPPPPSEARPTWPQAA